MLVALEGYTAAAAAAAAAAATVLGLTPSAAKTRLFRARERLKGAMGHAGHATTGAMLNGKLP